jgi:di/tricarboxylate transporter
LVNEMGARTLAIFIIAAGFWATEALPLFATAFVVIGLEILLLASDGGLADTLTKLLIWLDLPVRQLPDEQLMSAGTFLRPFSQDIIILFMGGFLLLIAMTKWWNLSAPALYEHALQRHEGLLRQLRPGRRERSDLLRLVRHRQDDPVSRS